MAVQNVRSQDKTTSSVFPFHKRLTKDPNLGVHSCTVQERECTGPLFLISLSLQGPRCDKSREKRFRISSSDPWPILARFGEISVGGPLFFFWTKVNMNSDGGLPPSRPQPPVYSPGGSDHYRAGATKVIFHRSIIVLSRRYVRCEMSQSQGCLVKRVC